MEKLKWKKPQASQAQCPFLQDRYKGQYSPSSSKCFLSTDNFPDVMTAIFKYHFARPTGIIPGSVRYQPGREPYGGVKGKYQWEHARQKNFEIDKLPKYDGTTEKFMATWSSAPTEQQLAMIKTGEFLSDPQTGKCSFPAHWDEEKGTMVISFILKRGDRYLLVNRANVTTTGIQGVRLLATCQQLNSEGSKFLYGNKFVFDTSGQAPYTNPCGIHPHNTFSVRPDLIPGLEYLDGSPMSQRKARIALEQMFDPVAKRHPGFILRDPLMKFLLQIGLRNAVLITKIVIEGIFKTAENIPGKMHQSPPSFKHLLPVYTNTMNYVCPNITELTLHQKEGVQLWDDDLDNKFGKSDNQRIEEVMEKVVKGLPYLQVLHLGNYLYSPSFLGKGLDKPWGSSVLWVDFVDKRHKDRLRAEAEKRIRVEKKVAAEATARLPGVVRDEEFPELGASLAAAASGIKSSSARDLATSDPKPTHRMGKKGAPGSRARKS